MTMKINMDESCGRLDQAWRPRVIAALNGQEVKLIRAKGVFPWHRHDDADEFFLVWKGQFSVEFRDRRVDMQEGECVLVPRGVEHRTSAAEDAYVLCFEPAGTVNTGNLAANEFTAPGGVSIFDADESAGDVDRRSRMAEFRERTRRLASATAATPQSDSVTLLRADRNR